MFRFRIACNCVCVNACASVRFNLQKQQRQITKTHSDYACGNVSRVQRQRETSKTLQREHSVHNTRPTTAQKVGCALYKNKQRKKKHATVSVSHCVPGAHSGHISMREAALDAALVPKHQIVCDF